jgi:hypothetical protein
MLDIVVEADRSVNSIAILYKIEELKMLFAPIGSRHYVKRRIGWLPKHGLIHD